MRLLRKLVTEDNEAVPGTVEADVEAARGRPAAATGVGPAAEGLPAVAGRPGELALELPRELAGVLVPLDDDMICVSSLQQGGFSACFRSWTLSPELSPLPLPLDSLPVDALPAPAH